MEQHQHQHRRDDDDNDVVSSMKGGGTTTGTGSGEDTWGTWEELLLACAVKRHGVKDWDSVAMEVQGKTSLPQLLTTAYNCKRKYHDLQRRFHDDQADQVLHHLKHLRLAQLRQDLHRYDVSILSLQLKVKRLEEEDSLKKKKDDEPKPDLVEEDSKRRTARSKEEEENDKKTPDEPDRSKQENQSVNGSNSTCSKTHEENHRNNKKSPNEPELHPTDSAEPSKGRSDKEDSESDEGSCETVAKNQRRQERGAAMAAASRESGGSSEAQSSASLTRKRRRSKVELEDQPNELVLGKSQPLAAIMQMIRGHQHGSLFQRRLTSQESDKYKSLVQQHVDLDTIQTKLQKDSYSCSTLTFYRDLLLLFTNAAVFYPKSSTESVAAHQLRRLVLNQMNKTNLITRPISSISGPSDSLPSQTTLPALAQARLPKHELERSDSLLTKHKSTAPIIVCRKRSSISSKPSIIALKASTTAAAEAPAAFDIKPPNSTKKPSDEDDGSDAAAKTKEKPVTGTRTSRRTTTTHDSNNASFSSTKRKPSSPAETPKAGKKRKTPEPATATASDKKRSGVADFLKRIKRNSPAQQKLKMKSGSGTSTSSKGAEQKKRGGNKTDKVKERVSRKSGGENKKQVKEENSPTKRSVGRPSKKAAETAAPPNGVSPKRSKENGGKQQQEASKRPKKRSGR